MSEPPVLPTEPAVPVAPFAARPLEPRGGGCSKPALVGCGVLLLLGVVGLVFMFVKAKSLLVWSLGKVEAGIVANLPGDFDDAERQRLGVAFQSAEAAIESGKMDPAALQNLQRALMKAVQQPKGQLSREELLDLIVALERVGGIAQPADPEAPPAEPRPSTPAPTAEPGREPAATISA